MPSLIEEEEERGTVRRDPLEGDREADGVGESGDVVALAVRAKRRLLRQIAVAVRVDPDFPRIPAAQCRHVEEVARILVLPQNAIESLPDGVHPVALLLRVRRVPHFARAPPIGATLFLAAIRQTFREVVASGDHAEPDGRPCRQIAR